MTGASDVLWSRNVVVPPALLVIGVSLTLWSWKMVCPPLLLVMLPNPPPPDTPDADLS
jgi:hypothetical protein